VARHTSDGGYGSPERQHDERRVAIEQGLVAANLVLGDIVLEVKASAFFAQSHHDRRLPVAEQFQRVFKCREILTLFNSLSH
jgi:hypothetical protein